jgi:hypothetical protein
VNAADTNAWVDGGGEGGELHFPDRAAGKVRQPLAPARLLHPATVHHEAQPLATVQPLAVLAVDEGVHAQAESLFQGMKPAAGSDTKPG